MKGNLKISALAAAVAMFAMGTAAASGGDVSPANVDTNVLTDIMVIGEIPAEGQVDVSGDLTVGGDVNLDYDYDYDDNFTRNVNVDKNTTKNYTEDVSLTADANLDLDADVDLVLDLSRTEAHNVETNFSSDESHTIRTNEVSSNIVRNEYGRTDVRGERDEHGVSVNIDKSLSLDSDITFTGAPTISGDIEIDSAAIALVDNRQSNTGNLGVNEMLENEASVGDDVGSDASGNLQFNVAAGDNNVQDNAAALSAADASFAFGLADAEIFVNQYGADNQTWNSGVTNDASLGNNAFANASGNIGANIAAGNNNQQKNALAASTATSAYAQASVSSNQNSTGNYVSNAGYVEERTSSIDVALTGDVSGLFTNSGTGTYEGSGNSYQSSNFYADMWEGEMHPEGPVIGHADFDNESQGAVMNPNRDGVGGLGFDNEESGTLAFDEVSELDLMASLAGSVATTQYVVVNATNSASLSGGAFAGASGNIGVNLAAGSGNLQANSLAMAVAQPGTGGTPPNGGGE